MDGQQHPALQGIAAHTFDAATGKLTLHGITEIPPEVFSVAHDIRILDISGNQVSRLPDNFGELGNLEIFFASFTSFHEVPPQLGGCPALMTIGMQGCSLESISETALQPSLKALILTDNRLTALPSRIGSLTELRRLTLTGNQLASIPDTLLECRNLEFLRLTANHLRQEPAWLFEHPALAWYGDASNSYTPALHTAPTKIQWDGLEVGTLLNSNRKSNVYAAASRSGGQGQELAVKVFSGAISADGYADDEIMANLALEQPGVMAVEGEPEGRQVLAMPLLNASLRPLGNPPSLQTVTRDVYAAGLALPEDLSLQILNATARQMANIHRHGVMHGDLYAHNILYNGQGACQLTDFGGSSLYPPANASLRERLEVLAFGILAGELAYLNPGTNDELTTIRDMCMRTKVSERPSFQELSQLIPVTLLGT